MLRWQALTCYFRHLEQIFQKAGITVTKENRRAVDEVIRGIVNVDDKGCPAVWTKVKKRIADDEDDFVSWLREAWKKREHKKAS